MEQISPLLDLPSPVSSYHYLYAQEEQYLDTHTSDSQSPQYDMSYLQDFGLGEVYPSPPAAGEGEADSPPSHEASPTAPKAPAKRKRENRYKNAPPSVLSRRRAQNRASQRAYRERKDQRIKDLEQMLSDSKQRNDVLSQAYQGLHAEFVKLKAARQMAAAAVHQHQGGHQGHHHQHHQQHCQPQQQPTTTTFAAFAADPSSALGLPDTGLDLDVFGYTDLATYAHI
ncbi:hypothetical protein MAPG_05748 [Magnaporthiopsis poae ATCC 64411]|uniref:Putative transcription factor kapC n=1 Tax=Magnaporthiopsis poae (strain ATCC 64411 / 73-15) TaxID=644358 RepID=A0A0C4E081_MAGP6|nr:hypothetical protein MAPG_05748 [Magnaporthiopsis poae ATCC 64411]